MSINCVNLSGNLTRDAEVRTTANGFTAMNFSIAVNDRVKDHATGEWREQPNYVDCVMFGKRAENIAQYLHKGRHVSLQGRLRYSAWEKDGEKRTKLDVVVDDIDFYTPRNGNDNAAPSNTQVGTPAYSVPADTGSDFADTDIVF